MNKKGLSILEIIIATVILAMVTMGLANIFVASKRWILHTRSRMTGGEVGRFFLDPLQMNVRQDTWGTNCLGLGNCSNQTATIGGKTYTADYTVSPNSPVTNVNKVKVSISWPEQSS